MRKSLEDIAFMVRDIPYPKALPQAIAHLHAYIADAGHCVLAVPRALLPEALRGDVTMYELPLPVKYVLAMGWEAIDGTDSIAVDVSYDPMLGASVPDGYEEF